MIKENKNVDFSTTRRQPSEEEFARISEWIKKTGKTNQNLRAAKNLKKAQTPE